LNAAVALYSLANRHSTSPSSASTSFYFFYQPQTVPDALKNHTSGTYIPFGEEQWAESTEVPFKDVPNVGFSDMEFYYSNETGAAVVVPGQFYCLSDNGFG
jgi:hypothetical protein